MNWEKPLMLDAILEILERFKPDFKLFSSKRSYGKVNALLGLHPKS